MIESYPEHKKLADVQAVSQKCGELLAWLQADKDVLFMKYDKNMNVYYPMPGSTEQVLAAFFGIDLQKVEEEKQRMLQIMRDMKR